MGSPSPPRRPTNNANPDNSWTIRQILLGIVGACLVLSLLSIISTIPDHEDNDDDPFLISHTLDPNIEIDRNYLSWGHEEWLTWLNRRTLLHTQVTDRQNSRSRSRRRLDTKPINTVVIASPRQITDTFTGNLITYGDEMVWSNNRLPTYLFRMDNRGRYRIYLCPPSYIAVRLVDGKPVHLDSFNSDRVTKGNSNYRFKNKCTLLA